MIRTLLLLTCLWGISLGAQNYYYSLDHDRNTSGYTLSSAATTSCGVYSPDGHLLRTLWNGKYQEAGTYPTPEWDGRDDEGQRLPAGPYRIQVLSNNVEYEWEGAGIGNTSTAKTGMRRHRGLMGFFRFIVVGDDIFYTNNYGEQQPASYRSSVTNPQQREAVLKKGAVVRQLCSDGQRVFWGAYDVYEKLSFVYVTDIATKEEYVYPQANTMRVTHGQRHQSALSMQKGADTHITGLAVSDRLLFVSRQERNEITVINLRNGRTVQRLRMTAPADMLADGKGGLWLLQGTKVTHHAIERDGRLSPGRSIEHLADPLAMALSPDGRTLAIADAGDRQQVRFFATDNGRETGSLGQRGGYANGPRVRADKFYFTDNRTRSFDSDIWTPQLNHGALAYQEDGSLWVLDVGNNRMLRYDRDLQYRDFIQYIPDWLSLGVNQTDPSRLFVDLLEFRIDYSARELADSWELTHNWGYYVDDDHNDPFNKLLQVTTLADGVTYSLLRKDRRYDLAVLDPETGLRIIGPTPAGLTARMGSDGAIYEVDATNSPRAVAWRKHTFSWNPAGQQLEFDVPTIAARLPLARPTDPVLRIGGLPSVGFVDGYKLLTFDGRPEEEGRGHGYHLGLLDTRDGSWLFRASPATGRGYRGDYPLDGRFDTGNGVHNAGSRAMIAGSNIIWGYYGEFWKGGYQTNQYAHYDKSGLLLRVFGTNWTQNPNGTNFIGFGGPVLTPFPGQAGNAFNPALVPAPDGTDRLYLYHPDESWHGGVHRWVIKNLGSVTMHEMRYALER